MSRAALEPRLEASNDPDVTALARRSYGVTANRGGPRARASPERYGD